MNNPENTIKFVCPACATDVNASGKRFVSEWAVALHVAGKIPWDRLHMAWVRKHAPDADLKRKGYRLGEELSLAIHEALKAKKNSDLTVTNPSVPSVMEQLKDIELQLHSHIKRRLQEGIGTDSEAWWFDGIPETIRIECAERRERDRGQQEPFNYTYLIDLKTVLDKNWVIFESDFAKIRKVVSSKKDFLDQIARLNDVRNRHFHPIRSPKPGSAASSDDEEFVSKMSRMVATFCDHTLE